MKKDLMQQQSHNTVARHLNIGTLVAKQICVMRFNVGRLKSRCWRRCYGSRQLRRACGGSFKLSITAATQPHTPTSVLHTSSTSPHSFIGGTLDNEDDEEPPLPPQGGLERRPLFGPVTASPTATLVLDDACSRSHYCHGKLVVPTAETRRERMEVPRVPVRLAQPPQHRGSVP